MTDDRERDYEQYLDWLTPTQREDYIACEMLNKSRTEQAKDRGVHRATISANITKVKERLQDVAEERSTGEGNEVR